MKNYGFIKPIVDDTQYRTMGGISLPKVVLQHEGNWTQFLPKYERQFGVGWDSFGCTVFGTLNCIETLLKSVYGKEYDFAERFIYNIAGVEPPGHDPHDIAEKIRKFGVIDQKELPMTSTLEEFKKPRPMTRELIDKGHLWLEKFGFKHEWVYTDNLKDISKRHELIRECLRYSPLGMSVTAWEKDINEEYVSNEKDNTHWVMSFRIDEKDRVYVFDSYDQEIKVLSPDHDIQFVKRYYIEEKSIEEQNRSLLKQVVDFLNNYVLYLFRQIYKVAGEVVGAVFSKRN